MATKKELIKEEFLHCCHESCIKVTDVRYEKQDLFCTLHTGLYGIQTDIKININPNRFILRENGLYVISIARLVFHSTLPGDPGRCTNKTIRKTKYK